MSKTTFTVPAKYSNQDFDEKQQRAQEITDEARAAGLPAPQYGYSAEAFAQAEREYADAVKVANARAKRNSASRARYQAMRDLGMVKTPYGWE